MVAPFTITTRRTSELDAAAQQSIVQLCTDAHQHDFSPLFSFLPADGLHVLGHIAAQLVSHAVVTTRWLQVDHGPLLRTAYIDAVATSPAHQGGGYGSALLRYLATAITAYDIACLETERESFYTHLGWEVWRGPLAGRMPHGELIPTPDQAGILILHLPRTPAVRLDSLLTIECQSARIW